MNRQWLFLLLAVVLIIYLWVPTLFTGIEVEREPEPDPLGATTRPELTGRPLRENTVIAERNLAGAPQKKSSAPSEESQEILLKGIPVAEKNLGLSLVGTVLADDPNKNIAFIYNRSTGQQEPYHEGDRIGEVLVKRILWNKVVIETERGEALLVMSFEGGSDGSSPGDDGLPNSFSSSSEDASSSPFTDLEPTVSSGPLYGGSSSGMGTATRGGGNAAVEGGGPVATGGIEAATGRGEAARSSRSSFEKIRSSSESEEGESSLPEPEPSVSSAPLW